MFANRQRQVEELVSQYCQKVLSCLEAFNRALARHCEDPKHQKILKRWEEVHAAESEADDLRRSAEVLMYSKTLFPESRGDIMRLLEMMDRVPNTAESVVRLIRDQHITVPRQFAPPILALARICHHCAEAMVEAVNTLFTDYAGAAVLVGKIDEMESEADRAEGDLLQEIFSGSMDGFAKIQIRDLVKMIAEISDRAENVGDHIRIIVAKRGI